MEILQFMLVGAVIFGGIAAVIVLVLCMLDFIADGLEPYIGLWSVVIAFAAVGAFIGSVIYVTALALSK